MKSIYNPLTRAEEQTGKNQAAMFTFGAFLGVVVGALVGLLRFISLERVSSSKVPNPEPGTNYSTDPSYSPASTHALTAQVSSPGVQSPDSAQEKTLAPASTSTSWSRTTKYIVGVILFLSVVLMIYVSRGSLSLIIMAALIAFIVRPIIGFFQNRAKLNRGAATIITYLLVLALLILIPLLVLPHIVNAINDVLSIDYQSIAENISAALDDYAQNASSIPILGQSIDASLETISNAVRSLVGDTTAEPVNVDLSLESLGNRLADTLGALVRVVGPVISAIISFAFMLIISLHMSLSAESVTESYPKMLPPGYREEISNLIDRITIIWSSFLRGQLTLMFIIGSLVYILNLILGTPYALFLGLVSGLLEIIPSLGPFLALFPATFVALTFGSNHFDISPLLFAVIIIISYSLIQVLENQVIVPKVLGDAVDLSPLVVILGVTIFGSLFGLLGVFLGSPIIATGKEIFKYLYDKILEPPVVEPPPEIKPSIFEMARDYAGRIRLRLRRRRPPEETAAVGSGNRHDAG